MNEISDGKMTIGKKAIEAEVKKLAAEAGLTSTTFTWVKNGTYYYLSASFGDYHIEWPFSKAQLEEYSFGNDYSYISRTLKREINSLLT